MKFFLQGWNFLQKQPDFDYSESKDVSAHLMLLGVDPHEGADDREGVHRPHHLVLAFEAEEAKEEKDQKDSLADLLHDLESPFCWLAFGRSVADDRNQEEEVAEELDLPRYPMFEDVLGPFLWGFFLRSLPLFELDLLGSWRVPFNLQLCWDGLGGKFDDGD